MAKKVFYSFHYADDAWRVQTVKNIGSVEGQPILTSNAWEEVKRGGDKAIEKWINEQLNYKDCLVVLVGSNTAGRKWVEYEIKEAWNRGKGLVGIYIHNLQNSSGLTSTKGLNPFRGFTIRNGSIDLSTILPIYDPTGFDSKQVYASIASNIESWVDAGIVARKRYSN